MRVIAVNRRTLAHVRGAEPAALIGNLAHILRDDMLHQHVEELVQLWNGNTSFSGMSVNYTLSGQRLNVELKGVILPGYEEDWARVLVAIEDVTAREQARQALALQTSYAHALFEHSPVSLWVEDFSAIKTLFDDLKTRGISDFRVFTDVHPDFVERCMSEIRVLDVNNRTLELFRRNIQAGSAIPPRRNFSRPDACFVPGTVDRSLGRQIFPAARSRQLHAGWRNPASAAAILRAARP